MKDSDLTLDQLDLKIVSLLSSDGRMTNNDIAAKLKISEGTVRNRMRRLSDSGALKVSGLVNPDFFPDRQMVFLEIKIATSKDLKKTAETISRLPGVSSVYIISGGADIMAELFLESKFGLIEFIGTHLASIDGIISTESHIVMKQYGKWLASSKK